MMEFLEKARRFLWLFVETGISGRSIADPDSSAARRMSGGYVSSVADNVTKFASGMGTPSLIGIGVILAIIYLLMQRMKV